MGYLHADFSFSILKYASFGEKISKHISMDGNQKLWHINSHNEKKIAQVIKQITIIKPNEMEIFSARRALN